MNIGEILETIQELPSETKVKAWMFKNDKMFYHVASYPLYRRGNQISIWEANRNGKRKTSTPLYTMLSDNYTECVTNFLVSIGITVE